MNKTLKFAPKLVPLILNRTKTTTWRLWDDKGLKEGDVVDFLEAGTKRHFVTAKLTKVYEKTFGTLTDDDKQGHEKYQSDQELFAFFKKSYKREVNADTPVK
ncbi:MAG: ASCH domain-containing protein, partial [Acidobacteriaceae bacterium]